MTRTSCDGSRGLLQAATVFLVGSLAMGDCSESFAQESESGEGAAALQEIVVTAQKRAQSITDVGMSITAATGDQLEMLGITDTSQLAKLVPGFTFTQTGYGTAVYTIRGVGFQESSLAASPAVSVYVDEIPLPFPAETVAAALDPQRVEVLKGPQGLLYGENSTGGAVNYVAAKPTDYFTAGAKGSYGRFNTGDLEAFVSGPIADTLQGRLAVRTVQGGDWQYSYTRSDTVGGKNLTQARLLLDWRPSDDLKVSLNLNGWLDKSDSQAAQLIGIFPESNLVPIPAGLSNFPRAPANNRAADWDPGLSLRRDDKFYQGSIRIDYKLPADLTLTSISAHERYQRDRPMDLDGTSYTNFGDLESGWIGTTFQELRLSGLFPEHRGNWIVGGNYESDDTSDTNLIRFPESSGSVAVGLPFVSANDTTRQDVRTKAIYGNSEYTLVDGLSLQGGMRYTRADRSFVGCTYDTGDGLLSAVFTRLAGVLQGNPIAPLAPGACGTLGSSFNPGIVNASLNESNLSWRTGLNWKLDPATLLYANVSRGYKSGSFPTLSASSAVQFTPVRQESVIAYEAGLKKELLTNTLQVNAAVFYYDYSDKQIRGRLQDPVFGTLEALVNIPKSHIDGFELSGTWRPFASLTVTPAVSLVHSQIDGDFSNYTLLGTLQNISGEAFPFTPRWSANLDAEYSLPLQGGYEAFVGENASYQSAANGGFGNLPEFKINSYVLLDLRAGIRNAGNWSLSIYGRNVTDKYYWTGSTHLIDTENRFAGMPRTYGVQASYQFH